MTGETLKADHEPHEVSFVFPDESVLVVSMFAVPSVGERIQIRGADYRIAAREWTIDYADERIHRCARVSFSLRAEAKGDPT